MNFPSRVRPHPYGADNTRRVINIVKQGTSDANGNWSSGEFVIPRIGDLVPQEALKLVSHRFELGTMRTSLRQTRNLHINILGRGAGCRAQYHVVIVV